MADEEKDETFFLEIFPDSSKLDAYAMAFDDIQVFEEAGHPRDHVGMLATYGFVHFSGMSKLLEGGSDLSLTPIILDAFFLDASFAVSLWTLLKPWGLQMAKTAGIAQKFEPGLPIQKALAAKRFLDLGSGDGRAVIAAAVLVPSLSESLGVELSMSRHQLAVKNRSRLPDALQDVVHFQQCDILQVEPALLGGTEIVWLANLRFPDETVLAINKYLDAHCAVEVDAVVAQN
ncbi:unnamed protein product [Durusdinium trenchii]|uniref:DOT1 domain-containing protein n=1 Tax=Durusdinium trenchii TaxID=1381693 RepID=A0ABP0QJ13_9DINO